MDFVAKLRDDFKYIIKNKVDDNEIHVYKGELYYTYNEVNNMFLHKEERNEKYIYYISIKIELFENKIKIYTDEIVLIAVDNESIVDIIPINKFTKSEVYIQNFVDHIRVNLISFIDYKSNQGRTVLLDNFFDKNNIPTWCQENVSKLSYMFKRHVVSSESAYIDIKRVIGTDHDSYNNKTWLEVFYSLKRGDNIVMALLMIEYYDRLQKKDNKIGLISFIKMDDEYYISQGNHRACMAKFKGIAFIYAPMTEYKTDYEYKGYYEKLKQLSLKVDILTHDEYENMKFRYNLHNDWEAFNVIYEDEHYLLCGIEIIKSFYNEITSIMRFRNKTFFQAVYKRHKKYVLRKRFSMY